MELFAKDMMAYSRAYDYYEYFLSHYTLLAVYLHFIGP